MRSIFVRTWIPTPTSGNAARLRRKQKAVGSSTRWQLLDPCLPGLDSRWLWLNPRWQRRAVSPTSPGSEARQNRKALRQLGRSTPHARDYVHLPVGNCADTLGHSWEDATQVRATCHCPLKRCGMDPATGWRLHRAPGGQRSVQADTRTRFLRPITATRRLRIAKRCVYYRNFTRPTAGLAYSYLPVHGCPARPAYSHAADVFTAVGLAWIRI